MALTHEQLPRVKLVVGRDHHRGPGCYNFGFMWKKAKEPREGWLAYERVLVLEWQFSWGLWKV